MNRREAPRNSAPAAPAPRADAAYEPRRDAPHATRADAAPSPRADAAPSPRADAAHESRADGGHELRADGAHVRRAGADVGIQRATGESGRALLAARGVALTAGGVGRHDAARTLVRELDWSARAGECWCIIGRNGAGKSTLLRALAGVGAPQAGDILLQDKPLRDWPLPALARERAFLAQFRNDAFSYRVIDTVLMARHPYHANSYWEDTDDHRIAHDALRQMDVLDLAQRDVRTLSGGERQRVAIAALLAQDTPLLLLDEPATALDLAHQVAVMRLLSHLAREQGKCIIMVGHDLNLAASAATHALLLMGDGSWHAGPADEVLVPALLTECLGHPIGIVQHGDRGDDRRGDDRRRIFINLET